MSGIGLHRSLGIPVICSLGNLMEIIKLLSRFHNLGDGNIILYQNSQINLYRDEVQEIKQNNGLKEYTIYIRNGSYGLKLWYFILIKTIIIINSKNHQGNLAIEYFFISVFFSS